MRSARRAGTFHRIFVAVLTAFLAVFAAGLALGDRSVLGQVARRRVEVAG